MKETVTTLAEKVAAGTMTAQEAGQQMRSMVTRPKVISTQAQRIESYNSAALETDPNSFIHVSALFSLGKISKADYDTLYAQVMS